jgi:general secretion pathway protein L
VSLGPSMSATPGLVSKLLDAFVEAVEPLFGRLVSKDRLVAVEDGHGLSFFAVTKGRVVPVGGSGGPEGRDLKRLRRARGDAVELRLQPSRILTRTLNLPAAGREFLEPIIEHRLERLVPWRPEKVLFGYVADGETAADGTMTVEFAATSEDIAAAAVARLEAFDLVPTALGSAAEPIDRPLRVDLYRGSRDVGRKRLRRTVGFALAIAFGLLVPATAGSVVIGGMADARLVELEQRLATKRNVLRAATGAGAAEGRDRDLIRSKSAETAVVLLIDRLATVVPDDTYLRELTIEGAELHMVGLSANAPSLIGVLEAEPALSNVRFAAPVTRTDDGRDSFDIVAAWDSRAAKPVEGADAARAPAGGDLP